MCCGHLPLTLEGLIPQAPAAIAQDPFNNFKPLVFKTVKDGWMIYSFGEDRKDDRGVGRYDPVKKGERGDIVFSSYAQ